MKRLSRKRIIKLSILVILLGVVFIRYNQKHPVAALKHIPLPKSASVAQPIPTPTPEVPDNTPSKATTRAVQKQIASVMPTTQKRYFLLDTPNDPYYASNWYFQNVNAPAAWNYTNDSSSVIVADIDSGFALLHQDLGSQWAINAGEYGDGKENNGIDDDGDGYIDNYRGWDFVNGDNTPQAGASNPTGQGVSHGTQTAGLIGATSGNSFGTSSIARNPKIMPLQVIDDDGNGYSDDVASAIYYAVDHGASIINMSLGTNGDDPLVRTAVDYAFQNNVVVVAAAGNCGNSTSGACQGQVAGYVTFPANYNRVIAVGASDSTNTRASFSSYGERVDIMAPGSGSIISTSWSNTNGMTLYTSNLYGTSFASPIVASSAALIRSIRPSTSIDDVRALLMGSAKKLSTMNSNFYTQSYGHGLLDIGKAIQIGSELNTSGDVAPSLLQTGGPASEHIYATTDTLASGCIARASTWCTVWLRNDITNYERFLPYTKTNISGQAGWNYSASVLNKGEWASLARQGDILSTTPYLLLKK